MSRRSSYLFSVARDCVVQHRQGEVLAEHLSGPRAMPRGGARRYTTRTLISRGWLIHDAMTGEVRLASHAVKFAELSKTILADRAGATLQPGAPAGAVTVARLTRERAS